MPKFRLTAPALRDVAEIVTFHHRNSASYIADEAESRLFTAFNDIADSPSVGHRRSDLTDRNIFFHYSRPYFLVFRRTKLSVQVLRVIHESRDLRKFI